MSSLTRSNPVRAGMLSPFAEFDDLLRGFGMRPHWREFEPTPEIRLDVNETDSAYTVKADIPGVNKDDIEIAIDGGKVSISAEVKRESEQKSESRVHSERYYGRVMRTFTLPIELDAGKAEARYENGVLKLTLPKKPNGSSRKINVA